MLLKETIFLQFDIFNINISLIGQLQWKFHFSKNNENKNYKKDKNKHLIVNELSHLDINFLYRSFIIWLCMDFMVPLFSPSDFKRQLRILKFKKKQLNEDDRFFSWCEMCYECNACSLDIKVIYLFSFFLNSFKCCLY